jgi:hypothetical protein
MSVLGVGFQFWFAFFGDQRLINVSVHDLLIFTLIISVLVVYFGTLQYLAFRRTGQILQKLENLQDLTSVSAALTADLLKESLNILRIKSGVLSEDNFSEQSLDIKSERMEDAQILENFEIISTKKKQDFIKTYFKNILMDIEKSMEIKITNLRNLNFRISGPDITIMHKTIVYVILVYREKLLSEISEEFSKYSEIPGNLNSTYSQGSCKQRTGNEKFEAFNERDLNLLGSDGLMYNFANYHSLMNEIKKPSTTDKKILLIIKLIIEIRRKVTMATALLTKIFETEISSSSFSLQDSVESQIFEWDKFSNF